MPNNRRKTKGRKMNYAPVRITKEEIAKINPASTAIYNDVGRWLQELVGPIYIPPTKYKKITHS